MSSTLNNFRNEFLHEFFRREDRFFLTGALAGFYLENREMNNLDLFTLEDAMQSGLAVVNEAARQLGAVVESIETALVFRLFTLEDAAEDTRLNCKVELKRMVSS
jgi:hypothetical protein